MKKENPIWQAASKGKHKKYKAPKTKLKLCTDEDCVVRLKKLTDRDLHVIYELLQALDEQMHSALRYELMYSKKVGYKAGQYWLHRKIDEVIGMAIQDVWDHICRGEHT